MSLSVSTASSPSWRAGDEGVIPNITQGDRMAGLLLYLAGPGRANEHEEPHLVAGDSALMAWHDDNELNRDAALDIANAVDRAQQFYKTEVDGGHVFHCSLSLSADEGQLTDQKWGAIAEDFMTEMGFTEDGGLAPARWVAVRHGLSKNGNDHIHIVASMVRDDGTKWNNWKSKYKSQQTARTLEAKYGLTELETIRAERGFTPAEQAKAARHGLPEVERHGLARKVRACVGASTDEAEFVRRARMEGLLVRPRYAAGRTDVVTGYSVAARPRKGERAVWYGGNSLGRDLALPKLRSDWESTPESATAAVAEWNAAARNRRPARPGRETLLPSADLWSRYANDISALREKLAATPYTDHAAWAQAARETAAVFGAWSKRIEPTPGPLADAARELSKSAQLRRYPYRPAVALPSARGAAMVLLAGTCRSERAAYALMFRQLALTARAIHDMHNATNDLRRVRGLSAAVIAAGRAVEASAAQHTITSHPGSMEALREQYPEAGEEALRARLIAERSKGGSPVPANLTRGQERDLALQRAGQVRPGEHDRDRRADSGIER
ncbi:relaxase/mobilization nuclease domain-containing protein [Paenarthrobacter sp. DKR-5]|uniref:relaxase/mobilization nuclease domain-containing protein n=1 Tax=Paenarthrobacter sp. DKR-5 TaxID=2835535 RepID=UPI001BDC5213|nr:relaxase/mobilization nuclease domain-containing protein [Paenarthrobacter sp. DKR-5]MBT1003911.1 relaxase/mobilization nuclease domain-containing protein [Paenarthrobacter sp. DKR-5]